MPASFQCTRSSPAHCLAGGQDNAAPTDYTALKAIRDIREFAFALGLTLMGCAGLLLLSSCLRLMSGQLWRGAKLLNCAVAVVGELHYVMVLPCVACALLVVLGVFAYCIGEALLSDDRPRVCVFAALPLQDARIQKPRLMGPPSKCRAASHEFCVLVLHCIGCPADGVQVFCMLHQCACFLPSGWKVHAHSGVPVPGAHMTLIPVHIAHVGMGSAVHLVSPDVPVLVPCVASLGAMRGLS